MQTNELVRTQNASDKMSYHTAAAFVFYMIAGIAAEITTLQLHLFAT